MPITRSVSQERTVSTRRPRVAAAVPRARATTALTAAVNTPMRRLRERPARVLASMSRPIQSVPKGWAKQGARFRREKSVTVPAWVHRAPRHGHRQQDRRRQQDQHQGPPPLIGLLHRRAAPLRILGSTAP